MNPLESFERAMGGALEFAQDHPLDWIDFTIRQWDFVTLVALEHFALFRAGNQVGKTIVGAALTIWACLGYHPSGALTRPPIEAWVVCTSWSQAVAIMKKVWDLVPKDELQPGQTFNPRTGFGKDNPALIFRNGSVLRFKTTGQGAEALAGSTIHWVWIDEPTDLDIYRELQKRVMRTRGRLIITLTPVNRDCGWLAELVREQKIREVHAKMDAAALTFRGSGQRMRLLDGTPMSDAWVAQQIHETPSMFVPVVVHGEWDTRPEGVFFVNYDDQKHVNGSVRFKRPEGAKLRYFLGIDYAAADRDFGQVAVLTQVLEVPRYGTNIRDTWVYVVDEVVLPGSSDSEDFAEDVVGMLERNGLTWGQLASVHGDLPVASRWEEKSNLQTMKALARRLRVPEKGLKPRILNAKEGVRSSASRDTGLRYVFAAISKGRLLVHPRCTHVRKAFQLFDYSRDHPYCDVVDALRYSLKLVIFPHGGTGGVTLRRAA